MPQRFLLVGSYPDSLLNFRGHLMEALLAEGLEVHVAAPNLPRDSDIRNHLEILGVRVHEVTLKRKGINPLTDTLTLFSLWRLMRKIRPHFFLGYTIKPVIYGNIAALLAGVTSRFALITGLGHAFQVRERQRSKTQAIAQNLYRVSLCRTHKIFFQNPDDEALFQKLEIIRRGQQKTVVVNGSGIDINNFFVADIPVNTHFLMIARLLGSKGVREYAEAAAIVRKKHPEVCFSLVGWIDEGPDAVSRAELQNWISSGILDYHGRLDDVRPAIAKSSVYVLPSYREGTPRTVLEAMSMGRPIVTTDAPGCRETVIHGYNGFLVAVKSVNELVFAMLKFIEQPKLISSMGERSRQIAEEKYDVHSVNDHMLTEMGIK